MQIVPPFYDPYFQKIKRAIPVKMEITGAK
jgi:hypothetical protein